MTVVVEEAVAGSLSKARCDNNECAPCRAAFKYDGSMIVPADQGSDYEDFKKLCTGKVCVCACEASVCVCVC